MSKCVGCCTGCRSGSAGMASSASMRSSAASIISKIAVMLMNVESGSANRDSITVTAASTATSSEPCVTQVTPAAITSSRPTSTTLVTITLGRAPLSWPMRCNLSRVQKLSCRRCAREPALRVARSTASPCVYSSVSPCVRSCACASMRTPRPKTGRRQRYSGRMAGKTSSMPKPSRQSQASTSREATRGVTTACAAMLTMVSV